MRRFWISILLLVALVVAGCAKTEAPTATKAPEAKPTATKVPEKEQFPNLQIFTIAYDGIAIVTHSDTELSSLTVEQVRDIFAGEIANLAEIGGPDATIIVVSREDAREVALPESGQRTQGGESLYLLLIFPEVIDDLPD